jgi:hypothetical protein
VESKTVVFAVRFPSFRRADQNIAELGHVVSREHACVDRVHEIAVVGRLLPVVADPAV